MDKNSVFDPGHQAEDTDSKIVAALERIAEAFRVSLWEKSVETGLSPIQMQLLIFIKFHPADMATITNLAREFNMRKATVSEAVKVLHRKKLVRKLPSPEDARSYTLALMPEGEAMAAAAAGFAGSLQAAVEGLSPDKKPDFLKTLLILISRLQSRGLVQMHRMCFNCRFFQPAGGKQVLPFCKLLQQPLPDNQLRLDCPEFEPVTE